jgi:hypothetical protein
VLVEGRLCVLSVCIRGVSYFLLAALMVPLAVRVNMGAKAFWKVFSLSCSTERGRGVP